MNGPTSSPLPTLLPQIRSCSQITLLIKETRQSSYLLWVVGFGIIQTSQPHSTSSHGNQGAPHPLCTRNAEPQSPWLLTLFLSATPGGPVWHVMCSPFRMGAYVSNHQLLSDLSSVRCHGFSHPPNYKAGILPSAMGQIRDVKNKKWQYAHHNCLVYLYFSLVAFWWKQNAVLLSSSGKLTPQDAGLGKSRLRAKSWFSGQVKGHGAGMAHPLPGRVLEEPRCSEGPTMSRNSNLGS